MIVSDFMTPNPLTIPSSLSLADAAKALFESGYSSVPVLENMGTPLGFLSEFSLIRSFLKLHQMKDKSKDQVYHFREYLEPLATVNHEADLNEAIRVLFSNTFHRALVEGPNGKIVGMVSPKDVLMVLTNKRHSLSKLESELADTQKQLRNISGKLKDAEEILSRYHSYLENAPFHIHSINEEGKVIFANQSLRKALGYEPQEIVGLKLDQLYVEEHAPGALSGLKKVMKSGAHEPVITSMRCKDGSEYRIEAISSALRATDGSFIATVTMSRRLSSDNMLRALHRVLDPTKGNPFD